METGPVRSEVWTFSCGVDGASFEAPGRPLEPMVLFLRSTGAGSLRHVGPTDEVLGTMTRRLEELLGGLRSEFAAGERARRAFEATCDPDADGSAFAFAAPPPCPDHGPGAVRFVTGHEPPVVELADAPPVTHERWSSLDRAQQDALLRAAVGG